MLIGFFQLRTAGGMFFTMIGFRKTVPSRMERMVPFGLFHACLRLYSFTRAAFGVMVAHLTPTPCSMTAFAASVVTASSVSSRCFTPRSKYFRSIFRWGKSSLSLIIFQMIRVISSPSISTMGFLTVMATVCSPLIACGDVPDAGDFNAGREDCQQNIRIVCGTWQRARATGFAVLLRFQPGRSAAFLHGKGAGAPVNHAHRQIAGGYRGRSFEKFAGKITESRETDRLLARPLQKISEQVDFAHALDLGMDRENVRRFCFQERQVVLNNEMFRILGPSEQFVQGRERGRELQGPVDGLVNAGEERVRSPGIAGVEQMRIIIRGKTQGIGLPARGARGPRRFAEYPLEFLPGFAELFIYFLAAHCHEPVLPADMVIAVDAGFVAFGANQAHHVSVSPADMRTRQQDAVQQRAQAVRGNHAGPADLAQEPRPEDAPDRSSGIVRAEREQERGLDVELVKETDKLRHADARSPVGVHVYFDGEENVAHGGFIRSTRSRACRGDSPGSFGGRS